MNRRVDLPDLAGRALGGSVVAVNDEFFAAADNLIKPEPPVFQPGAFGPKGHVYDGWETRRRRSRDGSDGHDEALLRLGVPGLVRHVVVDTAHFTGNYPPAASLDGCGVDGYPDAAALAGARWVPLVVTSPLAGDARNAFEVDSPYRITHVRLRVYPDGGVARLRVHGEPLPDPRLLPDVLDLAAVEHGGLVTGCSDGFYGAPGNLLAPGPARTMGEGWETARRRDEGNDWVVVRLGAPGTVLLVDLDTSHFKGNAPDRVVLRGMDARTDDAADAAAWFELLPDTALLPDTRHRFRVDAARPVTHVRLDVFPDGGMARLRLYGRIDPDGLADLWGRWRRSAVPPTG